MAQRITQLCLGARKDGICSFFSMVILWLYVENEQIKT